MSITIQEHLLVTYDGDTVDDIGLSDTIDNITADEIKGFIYCGAYNRNIRAFVPHTLNASLSDLDYVPFDFMLDPSNHRLIFDKGGTYPDAQYMGIVWLYTTLDSPDNFVEDNEDKYRIVCQWDAPNYFINLPAPAGTHSGATRWTDEDDTKCYSTANNNVSMHYNYIENNTEHDITVGHIFPFMAFLLDSGKLIFTKMRMNINGFRFREWGGGVDTPQQIASYTAIQHSFRSTGDSYDIFGTSVDTFEGNLPYSWNMGSGSQTSSNPNKWGTCKENVIFHTTGGGNNIGVKSSAAFEFYLNTRHEALLFWAGCGIKFFADKLYKPVITGGIVTGYSDNMSTVSDLDNWSGTANHSIPLKPPVTDGDVKDNEVDMPLAYIGGTAGMVSFIKINAAGLASADDISESISRFDITTIGKDLLRNFVSFKCFAVISIDDSVVRDIKVSGHTLKDGSDNALQGEYIGSVAPIDFEAGTISRFYHDYRDFAPYTKIQMYVPFCGWFDLPSWCMGKKITGTMFTDLYNGTVKAVIYASRTVVAEVGGCCSFDIPFAAESTGMKAGAVISSALSTIAMTGATVAAPNIATGIAAVSSAANLVSAANANGTVMKGVLGDGSNINGLLNVYIKVTRPNTPTATKLIPDEYKHVHGIPCFKELKLTAGDGYTQIMDANIKGAMTDREKQMIIDGFRHGLIL